MGTSSQSILVRCLVALVGLAVLTSIIVFVVIANLRVHVIDEVFGIQRLTTALLEYQNEHDFVPKVAQTTIEPDGRLVHSWRAYLLAYLGSELARYNVDSPWSSDENAHAASLSESVYWTVRSRHLHAEVITNYVAFSDTEVALNGKNRLGSGTKAMPADIIVLLSGSNLQIRPLEPTDLNVMELVSFEGSISEYLKADRDVVVLFGDLSIWVLSKDTPAKSLARFGTVSGAMANSREDELRPWLISVVKDGVMDSIQ